MTTQPELIDIPDEWSQTIASGESDSHVLEAYQRTDGLVLAIEEGTVTGSRYAITALPENWRDDNQPIRRYGDGGYLWEGDDIDTAKEELEMILADTESYT